MIRPIVTQRFLLRQVSEPAREADLEVARDLEETLRAHIGTCVGMAANMIGVRKRIIAVLNKDGSVLVMLNPDLVERKGPYDTREGCLSLPGVRDTKRYRRVLVAYDDTSMQRKQAWFEGDVAQAIQHEIDHCNGILI